MTQLAVAGKFTAKVLASNTYISENEKTGGFSVMLHLEVTDGGNAGETITWFGAISDAAVDYTAKALAEAFGYAGDFQDLYEGRCPFVSKECNIVTEIDSFGGKPQLKVRWLNALHRGKLANPANFAALRARLGGRAVAVAKAVIAEGGGTPCAPSPSVPAGAPPPARSQAAPARSQAAPADTEDDLPF
jgi:hypothetical protein